MADQGSDTMTVQVKCAAMNSTTSVSVARTATVMQLKEAIEKQGGNVPAALQRLIYAGHILKDHQTLESYSIKDGHTVHMVKGSAPAGSTPQPSAQSQGQQQQQQPAMPQAPLPFAFPGAGAAPQGAPAADPFGLAGMMGGLGGAGGMQQQMRQMMQNPEVMRQMLDSPMVRAMLDNPETMRALVNGNPQIRALIERNPELGHILNDPQVLRQSLEMARNPDLMREMMRNSDRAMSNIETMPEGYAAMRRFFTDVQQPMMDAMTQQQQGAAAGAAAQPTPQPVLGTTPNAQPLPNPWAPSQPAAQPAQPATGLGGQQTQQQQPGAAGLTGLFNGMGGFGGAAPDLNALAGMMQDPGMQTMMQQMLSNPELVRQMVEMNPVTRQLMDANPQMRDMLSNPQFLQQMADPQVIQAAVRMNQMGFNPLAAMGGLGGLGGANPFAFGVPPTEQPQQGAQPATAPVTPAQPVVPPEVRYRDQLQQLNDMGFTNQQENITAITATQGNVNWAVERLLGGGGAH